MTVSKDLVAAHLDVIILSILAEADSYGFAILQRVRETAVDSAEWPDGMLYPVLHRLERLGYVEAQWAVVAHGRRRKYYRTTPEGRRHAQRLLVPASTRGKQR